MSKDFVRQDTSRYSKLGRGRKKKQTWRKPKGRDSKMRLKRKGYPSSPSIGRRNKSTQDPNHQNPKLIKNVKDLSSMEKNEIGILAKVGARKKLELIKQAKESNQKLINVKETSK